MTSTAPAQTVPSKTAPTKAVPSKAVASIRWLAAPTSWSWVEQANAWPMEVLIDHAHCERKAAGAAVQMMFRYLCEPGLGEALSPLAREELEHFEQVLALIKARGRIWSRCLPRAMARTSRGRFAKVSRRECSIPFLWLG